MKRNHQTGTRPATASPPLEAFTVHYEWIESGVTKHGTTVSKGTSQQDAEARISRLHRHIMVKPKALPESVETFNDWRENQPTRSIENRD